MSSFIALLFLCGLVGVVALAVLLYYRRWWPALFLAIAFIAVISLLIATHVDSLSPIFVLGTKEVKANFHTPADPSAPTTVAVIYLVILAYSIMGLALALTCHNVHPEKRHARPVTLVLLYAFVFAVTVPLVHIYSGAFLIFSVSAVIATMVVYTGFAIYDSFVPPNPHPVGPTLGAETVSHLLFYVALFLICAGHLFCPSLANIVPLLALGFVAAATGAMGVVYESEAWPNLPTSRRSLTPLSSASLIVKRLSHLKLY